MFSNLNPIPALPRYPGPHKVGSTEFEVPISEISSESPVPDANITTVKFRLFYPTSPSASSKQTTYWLPSPQRQWTHAYASFLGANSRLSNFVSRLPSLVNYTTLPVVTDAPLLQNLRSQNYPLILFSHGLGGNFNTYSAICGSLASCGIVCAAPEHRDGSAPMSIVRKSYNEVATTIPYQKHSHSPSKEVLDARIAQLRVRLWELELVFTVLNGINKGQKYTNLAEPPATLKRDSTETPEFQGTFDMRPGHVTFAGHSFGAASIVQFVKTVYHHKHLPRLSPSQAEDPSWRPLYSPTTDSELVKQITPSTPVALLDLWTMPLRGETTQWLWEKPLPSYDRISEGSHSDVPNTIAIMSTEFYRWTDLLNRTKALLSRRPAETLQHLQHGKTATGSASVSEAPAASRLPDDITKSAPSPSSSADPSPSPSPNESEAPSPASSQSSLPLPNSDPAEPFLYTIPNSAHLSQSDFGVLFPNLTRYLMKAQEPENTILLNIRAILAVMRGQGLEVESAGNLKADEDTILKENGDIQRWRRLSLGSQ